VFDGFARTTISTSEAEIAVVHGGSGSPVLLLHGYPQTHAMWHAVAPQLAQRFTVVCPDLRGYGDSSHPSDGQNHSGYSKRAMALDQVELMDALGHRRFCVVGHDRGARVAHRLAFDHADRVERVAVLDIVPTYDVFHATNQALATGMFHWFFLIQPDGLPERMIGADPDFWLLKLLDRWGGHRAFAPEALEEYLRCFRNPATIHATCEDYRAGATIDLEHDEADLGRVVDIPALALWGGDGGFARVFDVLGAWRKRFASVEGKPLRCGHFLPEERPEDTMAALLRFLA